MSTRRTTDIDPTDVDDELDGDTIEADDVEETGNADDDLGDRDDVNHVDHVEHVEHVEHSWSWHGLQVTALFLCVLVVVQFVSFFVAHDIGTVTAATVADRWRSPTTRAFDWLVLVLAFVHAALAVHVAAVRAERSDRTQLAIDSVTFVVAAVFIGAITVVVLTIR